MFLRDGSGYQNGGIIPQEFSEKFQTAFDPPPLIFVKLSYKLFSSEKSEKKALYKKICNVIFWFENDLHPPPWKFSENSSVLVP